MINPVMLLMSLIGRLLERPASQRAKHRAPGTGLFNPFRRRLRVYSTYGGAEDCD
jgi:hypothetical protein